MHGGGSGYWDEEGTYFALGAQTEDTWNHEESLDKFLEILSLRGVKLDGLQEDTTLTRRLKGGYRILMVSMCDHDQYLGMGTRYPNNPRSPDAEVNGLQATLAAIDYTAANYPTTHVFAHGTSAGSVGVYAVGLSYAAEDIFLTGVVADSILGNRGSTVQAELAGQPGFPQQAGFDQAAISAKVGLWRSEASRLDPESRYAAGFNGTPILQIGGLIDPQCAGDRDPLPQAAADGFQNNCEWVAQPLKDLLLKDLDLTMHAVEIIEDAKHVPTLKVGIANDIVDAFIARVVANEPAFPFASLPENPTEDPLSPSPAPTTEDSLSASSSCSGHYGRRGLALAAAAAALAAMVLL
jgi:hypothetical protein